MGTEADGAIADALEVEGIISLNPYIVSPLVRQYTQAKLIISVGVILLGGGTVSTFSLIAQSILSCMAVSSSIREFHILFMLGSSNCGIAVRDHG